MEIVISFSIFITFTLSLLFLFNLFIRNRTKTSNLPPGSYGWPVIGETVEFLRSRRDESPEKFVTDRIEKYQSQIFKTCLVGEKVAVLCGPAGNKFLFGNENKLVNVWWPSSVRQLLGSCLSTISGEEAKLMRKMLFYFVSPDAFSKLYIKTMELSTRQHIRNHWQGTLNTSLYYIQVSFKGSFGCWFGIINQNESISWKIIQSNSSITASFVPDIVGCYSELLL